MAVPFDGLNYIYEPWIYETSPENPLQFDHATYAHPYS
jgi:predicted patatin/cPLA2 family phospholipase